MLKWWVLIPAGILLSLAVATLANVSCIGDNGQQVDWFMAYKLPRLDSTVNTEEFDGTTYIYMDNLTRVFLPGKHTLEGKIRVGDMSAVQQTLTQIYSDGTDIHLMYSDEFPGRHWSTEQYGHTKGVMGFDSQSGMWLVHSVPDFPSVKLEGYKWPGSGYDKGQIFFCISLAARHLKDVVYQLSLRQAHVYDSSVHDGVLASIVAAAELHTVRDTLGEMIRGDVTASRSSSIQKFYPAGTVYPAVSKLITLGGESIDAFSKTQGFGSSMYYWIAEYYQTFDMHVQSWRSDVKAKKTPSLCQGTSSDAALNNGVYATKIYNVDRIVVHPTLPDYPSSHDNSKWAVAIGRNPHSTGGKLTYICIADTDRVLSQASRGGGALCLPDTTPEASVFNSFRSMVKEYEPCPV